MNPRQLVATLLLAAVALASPLAGRADDTAEDMVQLDFQNAELTVVIETIARLTGKNFIYDDQVRGRVTIVSPSPMPVEQAYAVFESVLQVRGFTTVETPGGALKVIPLRDAKSSNVETIRSTRPPPNRDLFVTRLIPLRYIDAESIVTTLKPLVSKEAAMAAYEPTNTVIVTESASNIRRLIAILESIDIEIYKEELAVIRVEFADASTMADQISEIFGTTVSGAAPSPRRSSSRSSRSSRSTPQPAARRPGQLGKVRILTDERTNSLIVLAARTQLEEVRRLVRQLDVPVSGGGRIHVYYLQHADAEELAQTLSAMISGTPAAGGGAAGGAQAQAIRATVSGLAGGISVTADPATNSLVIQASQEGFNTLSAVIGKLDVARPQVLIEALIMEVDVTDGEELGFSGLVRIVNGDTKFAIALGSDAATAALLGPGTEPEDINNGLAAVSDLIEAFAPQQGIPFLGGFEHVDSDSTIQGIIRASASDSGTNIISAPHILTSDNEEAEIRIGDNIPIVTSRVQGATGVTTGALSTSVNVERQDIGVTLRVTPQITEGDTLRLDIFQEISAVNPGLTVATSLAAADTGVALSNRRVENTVVVADGDTVVIGGLISDEYSDEVNKVPWLGDIPFLGWAFKTTKRTLTKKNLLVFITPHIIRSRDDLERETIRKREEFANQAHKVLNLSERERAHEKKKQKEAEKKGEPYEPGRGLNPVRHALLDHEARYPLERMREIERIQAEERAQREALAVEAQPEYFLQAGLFGDETRAIDTLTTLLDLGYDATLVSGERAGQLLYEIRVGPYASLEQAEAARRVIERSHGLTPSILIKPPEQP
ncbi:MAG: type II secretion system secretin GspD [Deltaproteobacteria bacterium]|nr:type II secretion system secretin GspD [Deltaproteobacteria bacterium]